MFESSNSLRRGLSLEFQLLAACADFPAGAQMAEKLTELAGRIDDWAKFEQTARRHQLQGFAHARLASIDSVPEKFKERLTAEARQRATLNLRQAKATGELHHLLRNSGIKNLVLKGLPLSASLYQSLTIKRSGDIDLLVDPGDVPRTLDLLDQEGYVAMETGRPLSDRQISAVMRHFKEITLRNDRGLIIDLHWRLVDAASLLRDLDPFENARHVAIENVGEIAVLGEADEFAYLCVHGALSEWSRLKWLSDVNAFASLRSHSELEMLFQHAERLGAATAVLQALKLREIVWGKRMPSALEPAFAAIGGAEELVTYPLQRMAEPYRPPTSLAAIRRVSYEAGQRSKLYRNSGMAIRDLSGHLVALPDVMALPLPPGLDFLYVPLRPLLWLARHWGPH